MDDGWESSVSSACADMPFARAALTASAPVEEPTIVEPPPPVMAWT
jgi:hypothetical protein